MPKLFAVARHEFKMAAANKVFIILTILGPFLLLGVTVLPGLLAANPSLISDGVPVAVSGGDAGARAAVREAVEAQKRTLVDAGEDEEAVAEAKAAVLAGTYAALVHFKPGWESSGASLFTKTGTDAMLYGTVEDALDSYLRAGRIARSGLDPAVVEELTRDVPLAIVKLGADASEAESGEDDFVRTLFTAMSFVMLVYMTTLLYGQMIGRSVVQEKTSKTVEIMLSSLSARDLMFGKILGLGLAGLLQYSVWTGIALLASQVALPLLGMAAPPAVSPANLGWLVVFFVLAFFLYASGYAAIGAAAEDEHHLGQLSFVFLVFMIVPMVLISNLIMSPSSPLAIGLSLFPMTSPIVMLIRVLIAPPPAWQLALCLALLAAAIYGMAAAASKIFRVGILMSGKKAKPAEILRWLRTR